MTTSQAFNPPDRVICGACGVPCERGYSWTTVVDTKTDAVKSHEYRCLDCAERERWEEYRQTRVLRTRLLEDAGYEDWLRRNHYPKGWKRLQAAPNLLTEVILANDALHMVAKAFEREVWFKGLQPLVQKAKTHGQRVDTDKLKWLVFASAARCLNTLEDPKDGHSITLITSEDGDERVLGVRGVDGKLDDVLLLVQFALEVWRTTPSVIDDEQVRMLGM